MRRRPDWFVIGLLAVVLALIGVAYLFIGTSSNQATCPAAAKDVPTRCDDP